MATADLEQKLQDLIDVLKRTQGVGSSSGPVVFNANNVNQLVADLKKFSKTLNESNSATNQWIRQVKGQTTEFRNYSEQIKELDKNFSDLAAQARQSGTALSQEERNRYRAARASLVEEARINNRIAAFDLLQSSVTNLSKTFLTGAISTAGDFVKGLQSNASAFSVSSRVFTGLIDTGAGVVNTFGGALTAAGAAATMATNKWAKVLGIAGVLAGSALSSLASGASKLLKFGIEVLTTEVEQTIDAFRASSSAGALFANGMTELRASAAAAGLTVTQFAKVVSENSQALAFSGRGVSEGARQIGRVGAILRETGIQTELLKLGYSFEEQAAITAETMAKMQGLGARVTDKELASAAADLAKNYRLISAITGEDARRKTAEMRAQNEILAFQLKVAEMSPQQQAMIDQAMSTMTEMEARAYRSMVVNQGNIVDRDAAIMAAMNPAFAGRARAQYQATMAGEFSPQRMLAIQAEYGGAVGEGVKNLGDFAVASMQTGKYTNIANSALVDLRKSGVITSEALNAAQKGVEGQMKANDGLTTGVIAATKAIQDFRIALQEALLPYMTQYAQVTTALLAEIQKMAQASGINIPTATPPGGGKGTGAREMGLGEMIGRGAITALGFGLGLIPGVGTIGRLAGGLLGAATGFDLGDYIFGKRAYGGPVIPNKPYLVGEQGPELFRPGAAGDIVSNNQLRSASSKTDMLLAELKQIMQEQAALTKQIIETHQDGTEVMRDMRNINQQMLNNQY